MIPTQWLVAYCILAIAYAAIAITYLHYKQRRIGPKFPLWNSVDIKFYANGVSGRNLKSRRGRGGVFKRVLSVTVTADELWIRTYFPFSGLALLFDAEHRISLNSIRDIELHGRRLLIRADGKQGVAEIELWLRKSKQLHQQICMNR